MKKLFLVCLLTGILFIPSFYSCNKSDDNGSDTIHVYTVPVDAAAEYITIAFANASYGVNMHIENAAYYAQLSGPIDTSYNAVLADTNKTIRYSHAVDYTGAFKTNPRSFSFNVSSNGAFTSKVMSSNGEQFGQFTVTSLDTITNPLVFNGPGGDEGTQISATFMVQFSSNIHFTLKNVRVDKKNYMIKDGTATITIEGLGPASVSFSYSGTITFTGSRKATLVLNNQTYYMNLDTGAMGK